MNDAKRNKIFFIAAAFLSAAVLTVFVLLASFNDNSSLKNILINLHYYFLETDFLLIIIGFAGLLGMITAVFKKMNGLQTFYLLALLIIAFVLASFVAPRTHRLYYDEDIYQNIAQNLSALHKAELCNEGYTEYGVYNCRSGEYNKQPYGYPHLLSLAFRVFGASETTAFALNNFLFPASALLVFLIAYFLFGNFLTGLFSTLVFITLPQNSLWFGAANVEPSALFFAGLSFLAALFYLRKGNNWSLIFYASVLAYAIQFRPESIFIAPLTLLFIVLLKPAELKNGKFYFMISLFLLLALTQWLHLWAVRNDSWGSSANRMGFEYFLYNFKTNVLFYLRNVRFPALITLLFFVSFFDKKFIKQRFIIALWFFSFWGIFLLFYAGSYDYGADVRYSLVSYVPLSLLAGFGIVKLKSLFPKMEKHFSWVAGAVLLLQFSAFMPSIRAESQEAWAARADHKAAEKFAEILPENSFVFTHNPSMFLLWGKNAGQTSIITNERFYVDQIIFPKYKDEVYFDWNYWCIAPDSAQNGLCDNVLKNYNAKPVKKITEQNYEFVLYKLSKKPATKMKSGKFKIPVPQKNNN
ncbi:MAG: hypothetical protein GXO87_07720 [Chlorobi bacterium]|nr:hypothetical protein [Chlorobiota bacterium]